jgi:L-gulonolactone oxidase
VRNFIKTQVEQGVQTGNGYLNDGLTFEGYPVIGYNHHMQSSSGCQGNISSTSCPWETKQLRSNDTICVWDTQVNGFFFFHNSIAIPLSRIAEAIGDIKRLRDIDRSLMCGIDYYLGLFMRYFKKSEDYLSHKEDSVEIEFMYFRYREPGTPRWNEHVMEEMEQMLLQKYEGVPHWGKNRVYTFQGAAKRTVNLGKFLEVKKRLDPHGLFSSEWSDGVLGIGKHGVEIWRDGCAVDGLCVCKEDRHCAPEKGFLCRPGRVWKKARVCNQRSQ